MELGQQSEAESSSWMLKSSTARLGILPTREQVILVLKSSVNEKGEVGRDEQKDWQGTHMSPRD